MYLNYMNGNDKYVTYSTLPANGQFRFTAPINEPVIAGISLDKKWFSAEYPNAVTFFMEPDDMRISTACNAFKKAVITGSAFQKEYAVHQKQRLKFEKRWKIVMDTLSAINKRSNTQYQETKAWAPAPYREEYREVTPEFIQAHPGSYVTAWLLRFEGDL